MSFEDDIEKGSGGYSNFPSAGNRFTSTVNPSVGGYQNGPSRPTVGNTAYGTLNSPTASKFVGQDTEAEFTALYQKALENTKQLAAAVTQIGAMDQVLGTPRDSAALREKLRSLVNSSVNSAKSTKTDIESLSRMSATDKVKKAQVAKLDKDFDTWLGKLREVSRVAIAKEKASLPPAQAPQPTPTMSRDPETRQRDEEQQRLLQQQRDQMRYVDNEHDYNRSVIVERDDQVRDLEGKVIEINEIFQDLAKLTAEQSRMVDTIESNIEDTAHRTSEGVQQLQKASSSQRSSRSCMCYILLAVLVLAGLAVLIAFLGIHFAA